MRHDEERLQAACVRWFDLQYPSLRLLLHHSPNGGRRDAIEGARFKKMGTRAGFPDLVLLVPSGGRPFLAMELKSDIGRQSESQEAMELAMTAAGARYVVVRSFDEFRDEVERWMDGIF